MKKLIPLFIIINIILFSLLSASNTESKKNISGVYAYYQKTGGYYYVKQLYDDGLVIGNSILTKDLVKSWPNIKKWFNRNNISSKRFSTGKYYLDGNKIKFTLTSKIGKVDYSGSYQKNNLTLDSYSHINGFKSKNRKYRRYNFKATASTKSIKSISGVFAYNHKPGGYYYVKQLYNDGLVIGASISTKDLAKSWPGIRKWFNRNNRGSRKFSTGKYYLDGNKIKFTLTSKIGKVDYSGSYQKNNLTLDSYSHINSFKSKNRKYIRYNFKTISSTKSKKSISGVFAHFHKPGGYYYVQQLYDDGLVIGNSILTKDLVKSWPNIKKWFNRNNISSKKFSTGKYFFDGNIITFTLTSKIGKVDYSGFYKNNNLILDSYSHINGFKSKNRKYRRYNF